MSERLKTAKKSASTAKKFKTSVVKAEPMSFDLSSDESEEEVSNANNDFIIATADEKTEMVEENSKEIKKPYIFKPSNFGLTLWNPATTDINQYMDRVFRACKEAKQLGAQEHQLIRLIMRTLPDQFEFVESFISDTNKGDHKKFGAEVVRILGAKSQKKMHEFIKTQRKQGESILAYFSRIVMLYRSSNNINDSNWEQNTAHTGSIYAKIYDACYSEQRNELIRLADTELEKGTLTITKLKEILIDVSKLGNDKVASEMIEQINVVDQTKNDKKKPNKHRNVKCFFCSKMGHIKVNCWKWQQSVSEDGKNREKREEKDGRKA